MVTNTLTLSIRSIIHQALPLGTQVVSGAEMLDRPLRWTLIVSPETSLPYLEGNELLLVLPGAADNDRFIKAVAESGVSAIATIDPLPTVALAAAQMLGLPVLQLPPNIRIREVERAILSVLLDRQDETDRRGVQIYQQLVQLASENAGLDQIIHKLSQLIDKAVVVQDKRLRVHESAVPPRLAADWDRLLASLSDRVALPTSFQDRHKLPIHITPTLLQPFQGTGLSRLIAPIVNQGVGRGYLSFIAPNADFTDLDTLVSQHATVVCALEMARAKAISEIEKKLRGDFLDSLMLGSVSETEAMAEGDRYGHDMTAPHVALVIAWQGIHHPSIRRLETLLNGVALRYSNAIISRLHENEVRLFFAVNDSNPIQAARQLADDLQADARREYPSAHLAIGIGSLALRVSAWRMSYREAVQAVELAQRLKAESPLYIGDLGIYTLLARPDYRDDLLALRNSTIGNLIGYEERQRADLLLTLEAFFQAHGNHTQTADLLNVHRNTLTYRMNRIAEITGLDLNQPDVRLAVHLALKIHRLLGSEPA